MNPDDLVERVTLLVREAREAVASYAYATLTMTYWQVGALIDAEVLGKREGRLRGTDARDTVAGIGWAIRPRLRPGESARR